VSPAIWDHAVLSANWYRWTYPFLTPVKQAVTWFAYLREIEGWAGYYLCQWNEVNIGGDYEIGCSVCHSVCVYAWLIIISTCHAQPAGTVALSCGNFYIGSDMHSHEHLLVLPRWFTCNLMVTDWESNSQPLDHNYDTLWLSH